MPRASTSAQTLDTPGFRKSTPRRAAAQRASTNIASTSAQLLRDAAALQNQYSGKGKGRADDNESQWEGDEEPYGPQKGQVKRRQKRQSADRDERSSKRRKVGDTAPQLPTSSFVPTPRGAERAATTEREQIDPTAATSSPPRPARKKRRKQVRIAQLAPLPRSDESSAYEPGSASEDDEPDLGYPGPNAALGLAGQASVDEDWADPLSIPTAQPVRGRRYWQALELGIATSAVHDVATEEAHLGRALVQWELLRQRRAAEETDAVPTRDDTAGKLELHDAGGSTLATPEPESLTRQDHDDPDATPRPPKGQRRHRPLASHDPNRSLTPFAVSSLTADRLDMDEDGVNLLPLPASTALAKMARWPIRKARSPTPTGQAQMDALEDALLAQYERARQKEHEKDHVSPLAPREQRRARSAYGVGGPFYLSAQDLEGVLDDSASDTGSDLDDNDEEDLLNEVESLPQSLAAIPSTLDRILTRLLDFVPKAPSPAYDYWMQRPRTEEMLRDDARAGFVRDRCAPGWEEVLAIAKEQDLPAPLLTKLEDQLISLFGAPQRDMSKGLPLAGSADQFVVRVRKNTHQRPRDNAGEYEQDVGGVSEDEEGDDRDDGDDDDEDASQSREPGAGAPSSAVDTGVFLSASSQPASPSDDRILRSTASPTPSLASGSDAGSIADSQPRPKRKYKPYVYSEEQRLRKAAYKRDLRRREREEKLAAQNSLPETTVRGQPS